MLGSRAPRSLSVIECAVLGALKRHGHGGQVRRRHGVLDEHEQLTFLETDVVGHAPAQFAELGYGWGFVVL